MNEQYLQLTGEKDVHITKTETTIRESESENQRLRHAATRCVYIPVITSKFFLLLHVCACALTKESYLLILLPPSLFSAEEAHLVLQKVCEELKHKLSSAEAEKQSQCLKMTAEIDDLNRTKINLEERLIELIRYDLSVAQLSVVSRPSVGADMIL